MTTLADTLALPPLARRAEQQILRHARQLELGSDWAAAAAVRVLADPQLADALEAVDVLAAIRDLHAPVESTTDLGTVTMCGCCHRRWPCATGRLLTDTPGIATGSPRAGEPASMRVSGCDEREQGYVTPIFEVRA